MKNSLLLTFIVTLISALSLSAQIPDPVVYFDFEGDSGVMKVLQEVQAPLLVLTFQTD